MSGISKRKHFQLYISTVCQNLVVSRVFFTKNSGGSKLKNRVFLNGFAGSRYGFSIDFREVLGYLGVDLRAVSVATSGSAI